MKTLVTVVSNRWFILFSALVMFFVTYLLLVQLYQPRGKTIDDWAVSTSDEGPKPLALPFYTLLEKPAEMQFSTRLIYAKEDLLALPRLSGNRVEILVNEQVIRRIGGPSGTGNIWAQFHWIQLPDSGAGKPANLTLNFSGIYDIGIRETPFIAAPGDVMGFRFLTGVVFTSFYWVVLGLMTAFITFLLNYAIFDRKLRHSYLLIIVGIALSLFYLFDLIYREDTGSPGTYLLMRKLFMIAGFNSTWFLLAGIELYLVKKLRIAKYLLPAMAINIILITIQPDFISLKNITIASALIAYASLIALFILGMVRDIKPLVFSLGFFLLTLLASMASLLLPRFHIFLLQIGYLFASISVAYTVLNEFRQLQASIRQVTDKALHDPLTGAYNRFFLEQLETQPGDVIILADMNDFKRLNDRYGHSAGDTVLKEWVNTVREHIRDHDPVIRLGGDEFLIVLKGAKANMMKAIKKKFKERFSEMSASFSYGIQTIETTLEEAIDKADSRMYQNKSAEK